MKKIRAGASFAYRRIIMSKDCLFCKIINGEIKSGIMDKSILGRTGDSIYSVIAHRYGNHAAFEMLFKTQQISLIFNYELNQRANKRSLACQAGAAR